MDELTFLTLTAKEVSNSTNERLQALYNWSKALFGAFNYCSNDEHKQHVHAATVAADLLLRVKTVEDTGESMDPHFVDTLLSEKEEFAPKFYYRLSGNELTLDFSLYNVKTAKQVKLPIPPIDPLVLQVTPVEKSESSIVMPT